MSQLLSRNAFREAVLSRSNDKCVICRCFATAAHHVIERSLWPDGGYYIDNGVALCNTDHINAEKTTLTCEEVRKAAGISEVVIPPLFSKYNRYDKWGNIYLDDNNRLKGPLFNSEQCQKVLKFAGVLNQFRDYSEISDCIKYPRTRHIMGSGLQKDDVDDYADFDELEGKALVVEEKIDGANTAISFENCELRLQCRGHYLTGKGDWPEFDQFKVWANTWTNQLFDMLEDRYIMYGEWMSSFHSVYYDILPHHFMEFDIFDKKRRVFLDTKTRFFMREKATVDISSVRILENRLFKNMVDIQRCVGLSAFISENAYSNLEKQLVEKNIKGTDVLLELNKDRIMEGLYIKHEEDGIVKDRYKFVRGGFVQTILSAGEHWQKRATIPNKVIE